MRIISKIAKTILSTESEWNPKITIGLAITALLPGRASHLLKKHYYAYLMAHVPDDWEERDASVVPHLVSKGERVIDIGASIGMYTKLLARLVGPEGHVYSFEPNPPIFEFLAHNLRKLRLSNVTAFDCAVSDHEGQAPLLIPRYRWGSESHYDAMLEDGLQRDGLRRVQVSTSTLDTYFAESMKISFIKCDVNYHELACFRGGIRTLRFSHPALLVEVFPNPDDPTTTSHAMFDLLRREGYEVYWFDGQQMRRRNRGETGQNHNLFFLTREHVARLRTACVLCD